MPEQADGPLPLLLSQTGAFQEVSTLTPVRSLIPYDLNVPFWSDGAGKLRWVAVPTNTTIQFAPTGEWKFPSGIVFVKHFELATDETHPESKRRLETRLLICDSTGGVYGVTYKWRADNSDAELLRTNLSEAVVIRTATGTRTQTWYYPSRQDCLVCHTPLTGGVLGVKTRQLNRDFVYPSGVKTNELIAWNQLGLFNAGFSEADLPHYEKLATEDDSAQSIEDRARSYLDANCAHCHRPGGTVASFDARYETPLPKQNLINAPVLIDEGIDGARAIAPNDIWRSIAFMRSSRLDGTRMPPLAHSELDQRGLTLLRQWIESMPGPPVLSPPEISPRGGDYHQPVTVSLKAAEPGANIRYTSDGSVPTASDALYEKPIRLTGPTILRAKSFQPGFTRSITAQEVFNIGD
jgi:uncharacterized repeat protein (TIGR03806 family)